MERNLNVVQRHQLAVCFLFTSNKDTSIFCMPPPAVLAHFHNLVLRQAFRLYIYIHTYNRRSLSLQESARAPVPRNDKSDCKLEAVLRFTFHLSMYVPFAYIAPNSELLLTHLQIAHIIALN